MGLHETSHLDIHVYDAITIIGVQYMKHGANNLHIIDRPFYTLERL